MVLRAINIKQVSEKVGLKPTCLRELIAEGRFPLPQRLGKRTRFWLEQEVDDWLAARFAERGQKGGR